MLKISIAFFALLVVSACGLTMPTYQGNGFSLKYPSGWTPSTVDNTKLVTISHLNSALRSVDGILTVQAEPLNGNDINAVLANNEISLRATAASLESEKMTISDESALLWRYSQTVNNVVTNYRQAMLVKNSVIYTITAAVQSGATDLGDVETAIKSFNIN